MRTLFALIATTLALLACASAAQAAWYWTESAAETTIEEDYTGVDIAYCWGRGNWTRTDSGLRGYRRFRCTTDMADGSTESGRFFVRGKWLYDFYWDNY